MRAAFKFAAGEHSGTAAAIENLHAFQIADGGHQAISWTNTEASSSIVSGGFCTRRTQASICRLRSASFKYSSVDRPAARASRHPKACLTALDSTAAAHSQDRIALL